MSKKDFFNMVTVGDSLSGKTSLLCALKDGRLTNQEIPECFQTFTHKMKIDGKKLELGLWDTSGEAKYAGLRRLAYPTCDVFIVCYSVDSRDSFENIQKIWLPEIEKHGPPGASKVIVATKVDLRPRPSLTLNGSTNGASSVEKFVKYEEGMQLATYIKASGFLECSALNDSNVKDVFEQATRAAMRRLDDEKAKNKGRRGSGFTGRKRSK